VKRHAQLPWLLIIMVAGSSVINPSACTRQRSLESVQRAAAGEKSCRADGVCTGGFCDRGVCEIPVGVYGRACKPAPHTPEGPRDGKLNECGPYLCIDGRCRSCESDKQCRSELGSPRCYKLEGEPGLRCGNPAQ
jgi:hypothetical protein